MEYVMLGIIAYILVSLLIYYITVDWPWIVFSAALGLAMLGIGVGVLLCKPAPVRRILWQRL